MPAPSETYSLVIPQVLPVPSDAVYRKFNGEDWVNFVVDANNSVSSAQGLRGVCPPPGDNSYMLGLSEGHWCIKLDIEDGGPNDLDSVANGTIVDPGGVAVLASGNALPMANDDAVTLVLNTSATFSVLDNDIDTDGDAISVFAVSASLGQVVINADNTLTYTPPNNFVGRDDITYVITDGNGGTASGEVVITVLQNTAPTIVNDAASTDDRTAVLIDVLANDSDAENDSLTIVSASTDVGQVTITAEQRLRYEPVTAFNGVATITYVVTDGVSDVSGTVDVTVRAFEVIEVTSESSGGGAINHLMLLLLLLISIIRLYSQSQSSRRA